MAESYLFPVFQLIILSLFSTAFSANSSSSSSCPIDFGYVRSYPWDSSICQQSVQSDCCQTIHNLFGMGLAQHLKDTSAFYLPSLQSSSSCLSAFQAELSAMSITQQFASCLNDTNEFVVSPSNCAGISNLSDWDRRVDPSSANQLRLSCNVDLTGLTRCSSCLDAGLAVNSKLVSLSPNSSSKCFYYTVLYAAAIVNEFGPEDIRTATCILGIPLSSSPAKKKSNHSTAIYASLGAFLGVLIFVAGILVYKRWDKKKRQNAFQREYVRSIQARVLPNMGSKWFRIAELDHATDGFSQRNFIGRGAFGVVYKGTLSDGTLVAIKQMIDTDTKGDEEFVNEAEIISKIRHRNLLPLRGFCVTSDLIKGHQRYLVYDFMSNGSLDDHLFNPSRRNELSWPQRKNIIIDVAKGLAYLHYGIKPAIFHRDIKATNILLDSEMKARVADFGLAKESKEGQSHLTTRVAGTYGYLAPEYALYGQLTEKSDVYSFGIIVLEIMSGRKVLEISNTNQNMVLITDWAWELVKSGKVEEIFDSLMSSGEEPKGVMERFVRVGILCAHVMVALRPTISDALKMLEGDIDIPILPDRPLPLGHESFRSSFDQYSSMQSSQYSIATSNVINIT